ncbi:hypothetical protein MRX96_000223 [Rhipicephalus microplus]
MPSNSSACASQPLRVVCLLTGRGAFPELENKNTATVDQTPRHRGVARDCPCGAIACNRYNYPRFTSMQREVHDTGFCPKSRPLSALRDLTVPPLA